MPTYQYACTACDERLEVVQKFTDDSLTTCEVCGGPLKRLVSSPAVQFKGSGFYATDYARKSGGGAGKEGGKEGGGAKEGGDKPAADSAKSESKAGGDAKPAASSSGGSGPSSSASSGSSSSASSGSGSSSGGGD